MERGDGSRKLPPGISVQRTPAASTVSAPPLASAEPAEVTSGVKKYKPLVKDFDKNDANFGFDLARVKMEPGLLASEDPASIFSSFRKNSQQDQQQQQQRPPSPPAPAPPPPEPEPPANNTSASSQPEEEEAAEEEEEEEAMGEEEEEEGEAENLEEFDEETASNASSSSPFKKPSLSRKRNRSSSSNVSDSSAASSSHQQQQHQRPDDPSYKQQLSFYRTPIVGSETVCMFCLTRCADKDDPKLLTCLHSSCGECFATRVGEAKEEARKRVGAAAAGTAGDDDDVAPVAESEATVACPLCKVTTSESEVVENMFLRSDGGDLGDEAQHICNVSSSK